MAANVTFPTMPPLDPNGYDFSSGSWNSYEHNGVMYSMDWSSVGALTNVMIGPRIQALIEAIDERAHSAQRNGMATILQPHLIVTGEELTPMAQKFIRVMELTPDDEGKNYWDRSWEADEEYQHTVYGHDPFVLWYDVDAATWYISSAKGTISGNYWTSATETGTFTPLGAATGDLTVSNVYYQATKRKPLPHSILRAIHSAIWDFVFESNENYDPIGNYILGWRRYPDAAVPAKNNELWDFICTHGVVPVLPFSTVYPDASPWQVELWTQQTLKAQIENETSADVAAWFVEHPGYLLKKYMPIHVEWLLMVKTALDQLTVFGYGVPVRWLVNYGRDIADEFGDKIYGKSGENKTEYDEKEWDFETTESLEGAAYPQKVGLTLHESGWFVGRYAQLVHALPGIRECDADLYFIDAEEDGAVTLTASETDTKTPTFDERMGAPDEADITDPDDSYAQYAALILCDYRDGFTMRS